MEEKFERLSDEKKLGIINAGLEVFSQFEYKKASTQTIAYKAGISKGLLFHYFHNKETFFRYLYVYAQKKMKDGIYENWEDTNRDFFEAIERIAQIKCALLEENPYILNFLTTATYSKDETVQKGKVGCILLRYKKKIFQLFIPSALFYLQMSQVGRIKYIFQDFSF